MAKVTKVEHNVVPSFNDVKQWYEEHLHPDANDYNEEEVYKVYESGAFPGIFQLTSSGAQRLFMKAKPRSIVDIAVLTSIYRPGPLAAGVDKIYLKAKSGEKHDWGHPLFEQVLGETYNCLANDSKVMVASGEEVRIDQLEKGDRVISFSEITGTFEEDEVIAAVCNGERELLEIETEHGTLKLTPDHRVLTKVGWKEAQALTLDDEIVRYT